MDSKNFYRGGYKTIQIGDIIRCRSREDAGDVSNDLKSLGFTWGYTYKNKEHFVKVTGRR